MKKVLLLLLLTAACQSPVQGPAAHLPAEARAVVEVHKSASDHNIHITEVDGLLAFFVDGDRIALRPGRHAISVRVTFTGGSRVGRGTVVQTDRPGTTREQLVRFDARGGRTYRLTGQIVAGSAIIALIDKQSGAVVGGHKPK